MPNKKLNGLSLKDAQTVTADGKHLSWLLTSVHLKDAEGVKVKWC